MDADSSDSGNVRWNFFAWFFGKCYWCGYGTESYGSDGEYDDADYDAVVCYDAANGYCDEPDGVNNKHYDGPDSDGY